MEGFAPKKKVWKGEEALNHGTSPKTKENSDAIGQEYWRNYHKDLLPKNLCLMDIKGGLWGHMYKHLEQGGAG